MQMHAKVAYLIQFSFNMAASTQFLQVFGIERVTPKFSMTIILEGCQHGVKKEMKKPRRFRVIYAKRDKQKADIKDRKDLVPKSLC